MVAELQRARGFNLRIESLIVEIEKNPTCADPLYQVSISELRVLLLRDALRDDDKHNEVPFQSQN